MPGTKGHSGGDRGNFYGIRATVPLKKFLEELRHKEGKQSLSIEAWLVMGKLDGNKDIFLGLGKDFTEQDYDDLLKKWNRPEAEVAKDSPSRRMVECYISLGYPEGLSIPQYELLVEAKKVAGYYKVPEPTICNTNDKANEAEPEKTQEEKDREDEEHRIKNVREHLSYVQRCLDGELETQHRNQNEGLEVNKQKIEEYEKLVRELTETLKDRTEPLTSSAPPTTICIDSL